MRKTGVEMTYKLEKKRQWNKYFIWEGMLLCVSQARSSYGRCDRRPGDVIVVRAMWSSPSLGRPWCPACSLVPSWSPRAGTSWNRKEHSYYHYAIGRHYGIILIDVSDDWEKNMFSHAVRGGGGGWIDSAFPDRYPVIISPVFTNIMLIIPNCQAFCEIWEVVRFCNCKTEPLLYNIVYIILIFRAKTTLKWQRIGK